MGNTNIEWHRRDGVDVDVGGAEAEIQVVREGVPEEEGFHVGGAGYPGALPRA